jgi:hypothetical protein
MSFARRKVNGMAMKAAILVFCLLLTGCGLSVSATNSPDWCPNRSSTVPCP